MRWVSLVAFATCSVVFLSTATVSAAGQVSVYPIPSGSSPFGITLGPDGNMWFTEQFPSGSIGRITPAGIITEFPVAGSADSECIIKGAGNDLWFASNQSRLIGRITTSGVATTYTAPGMAPFCLTLGQDGNIWFTDTANVAVGRLHPKTGKIDEFKLATTSSNPLFIATGTDGYMYFSDFGAGAVGQIFPSIHPTIKEYSVPSGAGSGVFGVASMPGYNFVSERFAGKIATVDWIGNITEYPVAAGPAELAAQQKGLTNAVWFTTGATVNRFNPTTHGSSIVFVTPNGATAVTMASGPDRDLWFTAAGSGAGQNYIGLYENKL